MTEEENITPEAAGAPADEVAETSADATPQAIAEHETAPEPVEETISVPFGETAGILAQDDSDYIPEGFRTGPKDSGPRNERKMKIGLVTSDKMDKTITVAVQRKIKHPVYGKFINKTTKFAAHDETNDANPGDRVRIMETRPLSKRKRWRLVEIIERAK